MAEIGSAALAINIPGFVWTTYDDVGTVVAMRQLLFANRNSDVSTEAQRLLADVVQSLGDAWQSVDDGREAVVRSATDLDPGELQAAGLTGAQLELKLLTWRRARALLEQALAEAIRERPPREDIRELRSGIWVAAPLRRLEAGINNVAVKKILKATSRVFGYADIVLGSLVKPLQLAEPLAEIKQVVEQLSGEIADSIRT